MDLAFTHAGAPGLSLWRNVEGTALEPVALPDLQIARRLGPGADRLRQRRLGRSRRRRQRPARRAAASLVLRNDQGRFTDATAATGAAALTLKTPRAPCSPATSTATATRI